MNSIDLAYYPGCTLSSTAREIDEAVHQVCNQLDINLRELPDWNCCGSSSIHAVRPQLAVSLAARNLFQAQSMGRDLMVMCAGCANRLRVASNQLRHDETSRRVNREILGDALDRDLHVYHLMDATTSPEGKTLWRCPAAVTVGVALRALLRLSAGCAAGAEKLSQASWQHGVSHGLAWRRGASMGISG